MESEPVSVTEWTRMLMQHEKAMEKLSRAVKWSLNPEVHRKHEEFAERRREQARRVLRTHPEMLGALVYDLDRRARAVRRPTKKAQMECERLQAKLDEMCRSDADGE